MLTETEHQGLDIDWYFTNGVDVAFVASGGGRLPESISTSPINIGILSTFFNDLPEISEVVINEDLARIIGSEINNSYLKDFVQMAKKGLFSFDKTHLNKFNNTQYHLVAKPITPLKLDKLPEEIKDMIIKTLYNGDLSSFSNSNSLK